MEGREGQCKVKTRRGCNEDVNLGLSFDSVIKLVQAGSETENSRFIPITKYLHELLKLGLMSVKHLTMWLGRWELQPYGSHDDLNLNLG